MNTNNQLRSSNNKMINTSGLGDEVGARHKDTPPPQRGGGYLDNCTDSEVSEKKIRDPRIDELKAAGLGAVWREAAERAGYESFVILWQVLSEHAADAGRGQHLYIPRYTTFTRLQRNKLIVDLSAQGVGVKDIKKRVLKELDVSISVDHIRKVISYKA